MPIKRASNPLVGGLSWVAVTPNDDEDLPYGSPRGLWVNVPGTIVLRDITGNVEPFVVEVSGPVDLQPVRVLATGTDAEGIKAIY